MMKGQKNHYDASFKLRAVELSYERSNISELARELGIKSSLLYKWRKDYQEYGS
ncbi:transposase, partial [Empedobacter falsenii]